MSLLNKLKSLFPRVARIGQGYSDFHSLVLLWVAPFSFTEQALQAAAEEAIGRPLGKESREFVTVQSKSGGPQIGFVHMEKMVILVNNVRKSYFASEDIPRFLEQTKEMRIQKVIKQTAAWSSFDLMSPKPANRAEIVAFYGRACRMAAELLTGDCLGVLISELGAIRPNDDTLKDCLRSREPLKALRDWDPVPIVDETKNQELQAAVATARSRWGEFEEAFRNRSSGQAFLIKVLFSDDDPSNGEWMWVHVASLSEGIAEGTLTNDPVSVRSVKKGDLVRVPTAEVGDWVYNKGSRVHGGFADSLLREGPSK
jgi:uncharacterized protein YegJ (DUF2314 family)